MHKRRLGRAGRKHGTSHEMKDSYIDRLNER